MLQHLFTQSIYITYGDKFTVRVSDKYRKIDYKCFAPMLYAGLVCLKVRVNARAFASLSYVYWDLHIQRAALWVITLQVKSVTTAYFVFSVQIDCSEQGTLSVLGGQFPLGAPILKYMLYLNINDQKRMWLHLYKVSSLSL